MEQSAREAYGRTLVELGRQNPNIVVLDADLAKSTMTIMFAKEFPERFFDCGIAEQNMIGIAAGLAASGKIVFASTFAVFAPGRCYDQIRMSIAQPSLNVKLVTTHGGVTVGEDGASHQAVEDLALACSFPGFNVVVPADATEAAQAVMVAAQTCGPFYIRLTRTKVPPVYPPGYQFKLGQAATLRGGNDVTIMGTGLMVDVALKAAQMLARDGIECRVLSMSSLKPLDEDAVVKAAQETGAIITVEEHLRHGGLGSAVAQVVAEKWPVPMSIIAINDTYSKSGKAEELLQKQGLTADNVENTARSLLLRKRSSN
jgi:transketolase